MTKKKELDYKDLEDDFKKKVKDLRFACAHKKTIWVKEVYPGNFLMKAKTCKKCRKIIERKQV